MYPVLRSVTGGEENQYLDIMAEQYNILFHHSGLILF